MCQNLPEGTADTAAPGGRKAVPRWNQPLLISFASRLFATQLGSCKECASDMTSILQKPQTEFDEPITPTCSWSNRQARLLADEIPAAHRETQGFYEHS
jgi:hypothetical protein